MPAYILLTRLTPKGRKSLRGKPERLAHVNLEIKDYGYKVLAQYATLGPYDFLTVLEAEDNEDVARLAVGLGSRGTMEITTMAVIPLDEVMRRLRVPDDLGRLAKGQHARFFDRDTGQWRQ